MALQTCPFVGPSSTAKSASTNFSFISVTHTRPAVGPNVGVPDENRLPVIFIQAHRLGWRKDVRPTWPRFVKAGRASLVPLVVPIVIILGFFFGVFTATEAGALVAVLPGQGRHARSFAHPRRLRIDLRCFMWELVGGKGLQYLAAASEDLLRVHRPGAGSRLAQRVGRRPAIADLLNERQDHLGGAGVDAAVDAGGKLGGECHGAEESCAARRGRQTGQSEQA